MWNARNADINSPHDYMKLLESVWTSHLLPRESDAPTVASLFSGCGGSSLGYSVAGFREVLAVENDTHAAATFRKNFPGVPIYEGDIRSLSGSDALRLAGVEPGDLDVLDGSPPCQGFSTAGKRIMYDARNSLFREYVRMLRAFRPKAFIMENVSGMVKGKMKLIFAECMRELKASGYLVSCRLLDAKWFFVPQSRKRVIFIGIRKDLGVTPSHPSAATHPIPFGKVIECSMMRYGRKYGVGRDKWVESGKIASSVRAGALGYVLPSLDDKYGKLWDKVPWGKNASHVLNGTGFNGCVKPSPLKPCPTVSKTQVGRGFGTMVHPMEPRAITIEECKILCSFPDKFIIEGPYTKQWARLGNSVPPLFMAHIAAHVHEILMQAVIDDHANQSDMVI